MRHSNARFLLLPSIRNQSRYSVDPKIDWIPLSGVFKIADVFQLIIYGFNHQSLNLEEVYLQLESTCFSSSI